MDDNRPWLQRIVNSYLETSANDHLAEMAWHRDQTSLVDAIREAVLPHGRKHGHQFRVNGEKLAALQGLLLDDRRSVQDTRSFDELHALVEALAKRLWKDPVLTVYDTSTRLGAFLRFEPDKVYLHRGARQGAARMGVGRGRRWVAIRDLPEELQVLTAAQIEDCLCIYKKRFRRL